MTNEQIVKILKAERVEDPDPIIVAALQSKIESAMADPRDTLGDKNPAQAAAKVYEEYVDQFANPIAARADSLNKISEFQKHSQKISELEHEIDHARSEQEAIATAKSRHIAIQAELSHVDSGLHEIQQLLADCSPEACEQLIEESATNFLQGQPNFATGGYADPYARQRHLSALELLVFSEQRKLVINRALRKLTAKREELVEASKQLDEFLKKGSSK